MKVLFVCIKNTARSVMAEAIFNRLAKNWRAESAGLQKANEIDPKVRKILERDGLNAKEKPRSLEEVNLDEYSLIVAVCEESCLILPGKKVLRWQIQDPAGKGDEAYEKAFRELEFEVKKLIKDLEG